MLGKIPNSGSYSWTPSSNLANSGYPLYSYSIVLVDDVDPEITSYSETIEVLSPSYKTDFTGPYVPAVLGQPFRINWSPSTTPTISLILQEDIPVSPPPNTTIGGKSQHRPRQKISVNQRLMSTASPYQKLRFLHLASPIIIKLRRAGRMGTSSHRRRNRKHRCTDSDHNRCYKSAYLRVCVLFPSFPSLFSIPLPFP
jgi:hypothetical protein